MPKHLDTLDHSNIVESGFALIELLVVTTALAVVVGIVVILITNVLQRA